MSGHIANNKPGLPDQFPVGLSYCHKISTLHGMITVNGHVEPLRP